MQMLNAYSIYDRKSLTYNPPWYLSTDGAATRALQDLVNDPGSAIYKHPDDYVLYCVGTWLDTKGAFTPLDPLRHVCDAASLIKAAHFSPQETFDFAKSMQGNGSK